MEGVVCLADAEETKKMKAFVDNAPKFATLLPWATAENKGQGLFEKESLDIPDFAIVHGTLSLIEPSTCQYWLTMFSSRGLLSICMGSFESPKCRH
jgi:hypothetical protein